MNQYLTTGAQDKQQQDGSVAVGAVRCQSDKCSRKSDTGQCSAELVAVQLAQRRVSNSAEASNNQISDDGRIILNTVSSVFWMLFHCKCCNCSSNRWRGSCCADAVLAAVQQGQQQHRCSVYQSCIVVGGQQQRDISSVTGDDAEIGCCYRGQQHYKRVLVFVASDVFQP